MQNPQYYRLMRGNVVIGFKRVTIEYLPIDGEKWQLEPIDHNQLDERKLSKHPKGIKNFTPALKQRKEVIMELGKKVKIKATGVVGTIIGIWHDLFGVSQYNIRYYDTTNRKADSWLTKEELEPAE